MDIERRRTPRYDVFLDGEYGISQGAARCVIKDFSRSGACVVSPTCEDNSPLALKVRLPDIPDAIDMFGQIMWKQQVGDKWHIGFRIQHMDSGAKADILEYGFNQWVSNFPR